MSERKPDRPSVWTEFHTRHGRQNFTPAFNAYLEAQIEDASQPIPVRVNAWLLRGSWGNHSDSVVNPEGVLQTQADSARKFDVDRRVVNPVFVDLVARNYIRIVGREIFLIDDPTGRFAKSSPEPDPLPTDPEEKANGFTYFLEHIWGAGHPTEFHELQELERRHKEIRTRILTEYKAFKQTSERVGQTGDAPRPEGADNASERGRQAVGKGAHSGDGILISENGKLKTSSSEAPQPPARATTTGAKPSLKRVAEELRHFGEPDHDAVLQLVRSCRREAADCTEEEILHFVRIKGRLLKSGSIQNPIGFLLTAVPKCFSGESLHRFRKERERTSEAAAPAETLEQQIAHLEERIRVHEHHPQVGEWKASLEVLRKEQRRAARAGGAG